MSLDMLSQASLVTEMRRRLESDRIVGLTGLPGSGKSYTCRLLVEAWRQNGGVALTAPGDEFQRARRFFPFQHAISQSDTGRQVILKTASGAMAKGANAIPFAGPLAGFVIEKLFAHSVEMAKERYQFLTSEEQNVLYHLHLVSGVLPASEGEVEFKGMRIDKLGARRIASLGMGRSFQHVHLIPTLSVLENIAIGAHMRGRSGAVTSALRMNRAEEQRLLYLAAQNARRVGLGDHLDDQAGSLALGQQRLLEIARALCTAPELLLLDEPAAGLRLQEKEALAVLLHQLRQEGTSVLIVEHDMDFVMGLCDRLVVMEFGKKIAEGEPAAIQQNETVLAAYLGGIE